MKATAAIPAVILVLLLTGPVQAAESGGLEVSVQGVASDQGRVRVAVCTRETFLKAVCPYTTAVPAAPGRLQVHFRDVPPGEYAVQAFHDHNDNQDLDRSFLGIPKEPMGFSNDAPMSFGPPDFEEAAITVGPRGGRARMTLKLFRF